MSRVFISYSRSELTFADSLYHELQQAGQDVWMDIYGLQVGQPWQQQIDAAIAACEVMLLVVSPRAIASRNVCREWDLALKQGKRVILLLFRPARINSAACLKRGGGDVCKAADWDTLRGCEWVDFRYPFGMALRRLRHKLTAKPAPPTKPIRQWGWLIPPAPLAYVILSLIPAVAYFALLISIGATPSDFIGTSASLTETSVTNLVYLLVVPIPFMVYTRRFGVLETTVVAVAGLLLVNSVLGLLLLLSTGSGWLSPDPPSTNFVAGVVALNVLFGSQLLLLGSRGMYRWAKGRGVVIEAQPQRLLRPLRPVFALILALSVAVAVVGDVATGLLVALGCVGLPVAFGFGSMWAISRSSAHFRRQREGYSRSRARRSVAYALEAAPQDREIATAIDKVLSRQHQPVALTEAKVVLPLISQYQLTTQADLQRQAVIPLRLEDVFSAAHPSQRIDPRLGELQTIDFRRGLAPRKLEVIANYLDEPGRILAQIGEFPLHLRAVRPLAVDRLVMLSQMLVAVLVWLTFTWLLNYGVRLRPLPDELQTLAPTEVRRECWFNDSNCRSTSEDPASYSAFYRVKGFAKANFDDEARDSWLYPYGGASEGWCLLVGGANDEPLDLMGDNPAPEGAIYYQTSQGEWKLDHFVDEDSNGLYFDELRRGFDCDLKLVGTPQAISHTAQIAGTGVLAIGLGLLVIRRLQKRQRWVYALLVAWIGACVLAPHVALWWAGGVGMLLAFAVLNRNIRHYIP